MARTFTVELPVPAWVCDTVPALVAGDLAAVASNLATTGRPCIAFPDGADESAACTYQFPMPAEYAAGTLKLRILWCCAVGDVSKQVNWEVYVEAVTPADAIALDATSSFDALNDASPSCLGTAYYLIATEITLANKDNVAAGDLVRIGLRRDSDDDDAAGTAYLLTAELYEE